MSRGKTTSDTGSSRRLKRTLLVLLFLSLCSVAVAYLLWLDLQEDSDLGKGQVAVASIQVFEGNAKRRPGDRFRWFQVGRNRGVYAADSVSTGKGSRLILAFRDGTRVEVGENSLLTIESRADGQVSVKLKSGKYSFKAERAQAPPAPKVPKVPGAPIVPVVKAPPPAVVLESQGKVIDIADAEGAISVQDGLASVEVKKGAVSIGEGATVQKVDGSHLAQIATDGETQFSDISLRLLGPPAGELLQPERASHAAKVGFSWEQEGHLERASADIRLEISSELSFSRVWQSLKVTGRKATELPLPPGRYYWRLKATLQAAGKSKKKKTETKVTLSEVRPFEVLDPEPIELLEPRSSITIAATEDGAESLFAWSGHAGFKNYRLRFSSDPDFKEVLQEEELDDRTREFVKLKFQGRAYWRVEAEGEASRPIRVRSGSRPLFVAQALPAPVLAVGTTPSPGVSPPAPVVVTQVPFQILSPAEDTQFRLFRDGPGRIASQPVKLRWTCPQPDTRALLVLRERRAGIEKPVEILRRQITFPPGKEGSLRWDAKTPGSFEWELESKRCHSVSHFLVDVADETITPPNISVAGLAATNNRLIGDGLNKQELDLKLTWSPVVGATNYRVVFSRSPSFDQIDIERDVKSSSEVLKSDQFPFSPVFFRVEATTKDGKIVSSPVGKFAFDFLPPILTAPRNMELVSRKELKLKRLDRLVFSWEHTNFTESYRLELSDDPDFRRLVINEGSRDNFYVARSLPVGRYWWRTRSVRATVVSPPSKTYSFTVLP